MTMINNDTEDNIDDNTIDGSAKDGNNITMIITLKHNDSKFVTTGGRKTINANQGSSSIARSTIINNQSFNAAHT